MLAPLTAIFARVVVACLTGVVDGSSLCALALARTLRGDPGGRDCRVDHSDALLDDE